MKKLFANGVRLGFIGWLLLGALSKAWSEPLSISWKQKLPGAISGMSVAKAGEILVATNPDPDIEGSSNRFLLTLFDAKGNRKWQKVMEEPVKEQDISWDGKQIAVSNYGDQILFFNSGGKNLWSTQGTCKPYFLNPAKKVLCYHDEDVDSKVAFDLFDYSGKKILSRPIQGDVLGFKLGLDQKNFAIALTGGRVSLFSDEGTEIWNRSFPGEIVDVAVSSSPKPLVAILFREKKGSKKTNQTVQVLNHLGEAVLKKEIGFSALQIEMDPDADRVFYFGAGQLLGSLHLRALKGVSDWERKEDSQAVYFHPLLVGRHGLYFGIEKNHQKTESRNQFYITDLQGKPLASIALPCDEEAFFYSHRIAESSNGTKIAVAMDDGQIMELQTVPKKSR